MKKLLTLLILPIMLVFLFPVSASAETNGGVGPNSFFYFLDTTFEKVGLFFTFDSEKKVQKALVYAEERLAEAEESANDNKSKAVEKAMEDYEKKISLATEKSKELKNEKKVEELLNTVSESTAKHQEVLAKVLEKVPDEAKEAILKAIEISKRGQEEALKQITGLKGEIEQLRQEVAELKAKEETRNKEIEELNKQKSESKPESTKSTKPPVSKTTPEPKPTIPQQIKTIDTPIETKNNNPKISTDLLGSELLKFLNTQVIEQIKSDLDYYKKTISDLKSLVKMQKDIAYKGNQNCLASYNSKVEYAKSDAESQKTAYYESRSGFASSPGIVQNIDSQLERDLQDIEMWKDDCLAKYNIDTSIESRLTKVDSSLSSTQRRFNNSNDSVSSSEMNSIKNEILSISSALGNSLGVSGNVSLPTIQTQPSSVTCTNDISGFSCRDNFGSNAMRCTQTSPGYLNCSDSNFNNVSCQSGVVPGSVRCSW